MSALSLPEVKHMLDVLLGSLSALEELMKTAKKEKDPSIVRLCVSEAETASKTCVRLSQAISTYAAEHPAEVNKNTAPPRDPELDQMCDTFMGVMHDVGAVLRQQTLDRHVALLDDGTFREGDYHHRGVHMVAPGGDVLDLRDWFEVIDRHRGLTEAELTDLRSLQGDRAE